MANNEPWTAWMQNMEAMQKMMGTPAAMHPFAGLFGMPAMGQGFDPQQLMKALDPQEIDRRIHDLRAVESWMRLALQGIEMSIKTLEMQRDAYASFSKMGEAASASADAAFNAAASATHAATQAATQAAANAASATTATTAHRPIKRAARSRRPKAAG